MSRRCLLSLAGLGLLTVSALGQAAPRISADHAWIRLLPSGLPAAGYVVLHNQGDQALVLDAASSPRYGSVMLHVSRQRGGMSSMEMVDQIAIHGRSDLRLAPGSFHLMLEQPVAPAPKVGDTVPVTLHFDGGQQLQVAFRVRPANAVSDQDGAGP